jgi:hypothetical protein
MDEREFERRILAAASHHTSAVRRDLAQISAEMNAADGALRNAMTWREPAGELGAPRARRAGAATRLRAVNPPKPSSGFKRRSS